MGLSIMCRQGRNGWAVAARLIVCGCLRLSRPAGALPAADALACATLNGARALGLDHAIGSIVIGKQADLCAFDLSQLETQPVFDPLSHLVYACSREHVTDGWVAGEPVVQMRQAVQRGRELDLPEAMRAMGAWQNQIRQFIDAQRP